jgi:pimeloyl-ACP methyl ester carboxylesterase
MAIDRIESVRRFRDCRGLSIRIAGLIFLLLAASWPPLWAEDKKPAADKDAELPKGEEMTLTTDDGLQLALTYYPGTKGKESIPVVLLHAFKGNRTNFTKEFAQFLQNQGCAVVVPDLRGHGGSTRFKNARKDEKPLDANKMPPGQFSLMAVQDMKAVKEFLWDKNNCGDLNLDKLCVVGAEMGASVALDFARFDAVGYDLGSTAYGPLKLGGFVKALVLISPEQLSFKGIPASRALQNPAVRSDISILIIVGKEEVKSLDEANRIYKMFEPGHPKPEREKEEERQTLFWDPLDTNLQGANLLDKKGKDLNVDKDIADFIDLRLKKSDPSKTWVWKERKLPHQ